MPEPTAASACIRIATPPLLSEVADGCHSPDSTTPTSETLATPPIPPTHLRSTDILLQETLPPDVLVMQNRGDITRVMREMGISPWAAVLAVGGSAAPFPDVTAETEKETGLEECRMRGGGSKESMVGLGIRQRRQPSRRSSEFGDQAVAEDDASVLRIKRQFILKLARLFHQFGAPSHRFEHHMEQVAKTLNMRAEFNLLPSLILVSFENAETGESNTQLIKVTGGINMAKLAQVNALCLTLTQGLIDVHAAWDMLEGVRSAKDHSDAILQVTYPICGFGVALLLFQLTWFESSVAGFLGLILGIMSFLAEKYSGFGYLFEFFGSLVATFLARAIQGMFRDQCYDFVKVTLSALAVFVPGLGLTIAIIELSTKNIVSGTVRLIGALFNSMLYGFGMTLGSALVLWDTSPSANTPTCSPTSPLWATVFLIPLAMSVNLIQQANRHQWPVMTLASALGYATYSFLNTIPSVAAQPTAVTALAGLVIGLTGNIYARWTNDVAVAPIFSAIMLQVPGALSVKSTLGIFGTTASVGSAPTGIDGVTFTFQMLSIGMSLAM
ncbi:hypothetical protein HDU98_004523 [Podochytrium sp. JEL0797]|nr:hypothetical protein HDU98_004523 [Podochytrium sp. JEL0797]